MGLTTYGVQDAPLKIREVLFIDTADFRLYNSAFILRRRIPYQDGFPIGDPEIVFKFRHPDIQMAAETDVRPQILGDHRVKFKCQALPLKEKLGGIRLLFSHNVQFPRSAMGLISEDMRNMDFMVEIFPVLARVKKEPGEKIELVSNTIIEEVLQDIGLLDFGQGVTAKTNVAIWRTRGEHRPLIGEFDFQVRFKDRKELGREAMQRVEAFFVALQYAAEDYITLNATKTGTFTDCLATRPSRTNDLAAVSVPQGRGAPGAAGPLVRSSPRNPVRRQRLPRHDDRLVDLAGDRRQQSDLGDRLHGCGLGPAAGGGAPALPEPARQRAGRLRGWLLLPPAGRRSATGCSPSRSP